MDKHQAAAVDLEAAADEIEGALAHLASALFARATHNASMLAPTLEAQGLMIMRFIATQGPVSPVAMVQETGIDRKVVIAQLQILRVAGLISAIPNEYSRDHNRYSATRRGFKRLEEIRLANKIHYVQSLSTWSGAQIAQLTEALTAFAGGIQPLASKE